MVLLQTITEEDFGRPTHADQWPTYRLRPSARAVLFDDTSRVALMHVVSDNYYKLPGGGIDEGEDIHTGLKRELLEEVGAKSIDILGEIGQIDVYFEELKMAAGHPGPADRGQRGLRGMGRGCAIRDVPSGLALSRVVSAVVRRDRHDAQRGRVAQGTARRLSSSRPDSQSPARSARRAAGGDHLGRGDSRDGPVSRDR